MERNKTIHRRGQEPMYECPKCGKPHHWSQGVCIDCLLDAVPWKEGDTVRVKADGRTGKVVYRYYNGFTMVDTGQPIRGGVLNNDGTFANGELELVA